MNLELPTLQTTNPPDIAQRGRAIIGDVARALPFSGLGIASQIDGIAQGPMPSQTASPLDAFGGIGGGMLGPGSALGDLLSQLMALLGQLFGGNTPTGGTQNETPFTNASGSSTGDPHLGFSGTQTNGQTTNSRWNSMTGHNDLLDSDSFTGGFQVSTQTTAPNAQGVTYNQSATITSGWGGTSVSLDNAGNATISQNGNSYSLAVGQSVDLGNGESATRNNDGSLHVIMSNGSGGTISTTLSENGQGVDVNAVATNVDLGGDLVNGLPPATPPWQPPSGIRDPIRLTPLTPTTPRV
ncbi:MAG: hypothetical protein ACYDA1_07025 [Vulcanimicrobiaceae bacterium]